MLLTNHTLTGLVLSQAIPNPLLLAPAAFASHLACDSLPHFGVPGWGFATKKWIRLAAVDNLVALVIAGTVLVTHPHQWVQVVVGVGFACLPDLLFIPEIVLKLKRPLFPWFRKHVHARVQWSESIPGGITEAVWAALMVTALSQLLK